MSSLRAFTTNHARAYVAGVRWQFAKTMPQWPHEYTVREWRLDLEDVHLNIEARLTALVGDAGKRLHTGRSRNDQVATDVRLWLRDEIEAIGALLAGLQRALVELAGQHLVAPGLRRRFQLIAGQELQIGLDAVQAEGGVQFIQQGWQLLAEELMRFAQTAALIEWRKI